MAKTPVRNSSKANTRAARTRERQKQVTISDNAPGKPLVTLPKLPSVRWDKISPEHKLDLLGVLLSLIGLFFLFTLIAPERSGLPGLFATLLFKVSGWGAFLVPIALTGIGLWLILRKIEKLPALSLERLTGLAILYINLLVWMHLLSNSSWEQAAAEKGGGYLGAFTSLLLVSALGKNGAFVVSAAWTLLGLEITLNLSLLNLFFLPFKPIIRHLPIKWQMFFRGQQNQNSLSPPPIIEPETNGKEDLPPDFQPIPSRWRLPSIQRRTVKPTEAENPPIPTPVIQSQPASSWTLPAVEAIFDPGTPMDIQENIERERARIIEESLTAFGAPGHVVEVHRGPTITQYGVEPDFIESRSGRTRVRVSKIASLADDLALALAVPRIRIQAPVPGRTYVGVEVPNPETSRVTLREIIESIVFQSITSPLRIGLGKDVSGIPVAADLKAMPHLLIAGTTGAGKSVCVNAILCSFLLFNTPADLRLVLVDPKRVELSGYNGIPHLLTPVIVEADQVIGALQWMLREMDSRYLKFTNAKVRNIQEYNAQKPEAERLPHLVIVVDELADLMMIAPEETERSITRLAQLSRATGIHMILATQRPSVDVITGLIKANFPARVAFSVASGVDSRVILDQPGAERLLGRGDMLFMSPDSANLRRLQGAYVSDNEIQLLVNYWRFNASASGTVTHDNVGEPIDTLPRGLPLKQIPLWEEGGEKGDPLLGDAIELARREQRASITMLQRHLRIGYSRAARIIDAMEEKGIIAPAQPNSQVREILDYGENSTPDQAQSS